MNRVTIVPMVMLIVVGSGCLMDEGRERRASWSAVQELKLAYRDASREQKLEAKQRWADAVRLHLTKWPDHEAAVRTWNDLQLEYAEQLEANGHFHRAELHFASLTERKPDHLAAIRGLERVRKRQSLSRLDFQRIQPGMTTRDILHHFGLPRPGWERRETRDGVPIESWYYRDDEGRIRGVHFRNGVVFEVDLE